MSKVLVTESYLEDVADAIREKNGLSTLYTPAQMGDAIRDLDSYPVDNALSPESTNPVQNKVITTAITNLTSLVNAENIIFSDPNNDGHVIVTKGVTSGVTS